MRDDESDGAGGWYRPQEYISPWTPRDEEFSREQRAASGAAFPPEDGHQDMIAFGRPDHGGQAGYGEPPGGGPFGGERFGGGPFGGGPFGGGHRGVRRAAAGGERQERERECHRE